MFPLMNDLPLALILFLASTAAASPSSSIQDSPQQHPKAAAATAMKMLPAMKMKLSPANQRPIETDYFKPKEYTSKDFPRLVEGLGQQISRDLEKVRICYLWVVEKFRVFQAHFAMAAQAEQVRQVQERLERLERILPATPETAADGYWPPNMVGSQQIFYPFTSPTIAVFGCALFRAHVCPRPSPCRPLFFAETFVTESAQWDDEAHPFGQQLQ